MRSERTVEPPTSITTTTPQRVTAQVKHKTTTINCCLPNYQSRRAASGAKEQKRRMKQGNDDFNQACAIRSPIDRSSPGFGRQGVGNDGLPLRGTVDGWHSIGGAGGYRRPVGLQGLEACWRPTSFPGPSRNLRMHDLTRELCRSIHGFARFPNPIHCSGGTTRLRAVDQRQAIHQAPIH